MNLIPPVYAAVTNPVLPLSFVSTTDPCGATNTIIQTIFSLFFLVAVLYFFYFIFLAGFHWIDSEGDPKKIEAAKNQFVYGLVGLTIIFSVFAILKIVGVIFGITGLGTLTLTWPSLGSGCGGGGSIQLPGGSVHPGGLTPN